MGHSLDPYRDPIKLNRAPDASGAIAEPRTYPVLPPSAERELIEVGESELLLEPRDLRDGALEAFAPELFLLLVLEFLAELAVRLSAEQIVERREEHRVLAGGMRAVHAVEDAEEGRELLRVAAVAQPDNVRRDGAAGLVLPAQRGGQIRQLLRLLQAGKDEILFQLLVVLLDHPAHDARARR